MSSLEPYNQQTPPLPTQTPAGPNQQESQTDEWWRRPSPDPYSMQWDPNTFRPIGERGAPRGPWAIHYQYRAEAEAAAARSRYFQGAEQAYNQGINLFGSYRPGGAASLAAGLFQGKANLLYNIGTQQEAPDMLADYRRDEAASARRRARNASYLGMAANVLSGGLAAAGQFANAGQPQPGPTPGTTPASSGAGPGAAAAGMAGGGQAGAAGATAGGIGGTAAAGGLAGATASGLGGAAMLRMAPGGGTINSPGQTGTPQAPPAMPSQPGSDQGAGGQPGQRRGGGPAPSGPPTVPQPPGAGPGAPPMAGTGVGGQPRPLHQGLAAASAAMTPGSTEMAVVDRGEQMGPGTEHAAWWSAFSDSVTMLANNMMKLMETSK